MGLQLSSVSFRACVRVWLVCSAVPDVRGPMVLAEVSLDEPETVCSREMFLC